MLSIQCASLPPPLTGVRNISCKLGMHNIMFPFFCGYITVPRAIFRWCSITVGTWTIGCRYHLPCSTMTAGIGHASFIQQLVSVIRSTLLIVTDGHPLLLRYRWVKLGYGGTRKSSGISTAAYNSLSTHLSKH